MDGDLEALLAQATMSRQVQLTDQCHHCNEKKALAKKAQDASEKVTPLNTSPKPNPYPKSLTLTLSP